MKERVIIWAIAVLTGYTGLANRDQSIRFQHITTQNGLAQNMVDCMLQDQHGFIWFGTWNGLCKYDGYTFEVFNSQTDQSTTLGNNFIYALEEDQFGNIWVGTSQGLYVYLYSSKSFKSIYHGDGLSSTNSYHKIVSSDQGNILIGSSQGLSRLKVLNDLADFEVISYLPLNTQKDGLKGTLVQALHEEQSGMLWVGTDSALYRLDRELNRLATYQFDPNDVGSITTDIILDVFESAQGDIWVGTEVGLNMYDRSNDSFIRFYNDPSNANSLIHNSVLDLDQMPNGDLLIATLGGLSVLDIKTFEFSNYQNIPTDNFSLNNDFLNCLLVDDERNVWIGTERGGMNIINSRQSNFEPIKFEIGNKNSLSHSTINSIYEDEKYLWVGTAGGGLNRYNSEHNQFKHYRSNLNDPTSLSSEFVTKIYRLKNGELWIGTWGQGINILINEGKKNEGFRRINSANSSLSNSFVSSILEDRWGNIWVGTLGGLYCREAKTGQFKLIHAKNLHVGISGVGCLAMDSKSFLWIGTQEGLFRLNPLHPMESVRAFLHDETNPNTISDNYILSLIEDHRGNIWAGTYGKGINQISFQGDDVRIKSYDTRSGLSNNIVYGIEESDDHHLWLSTDYGLSRFDPEQGLSRNFYISDGLLNNQYYWSSSFKSKEGKLYFGGMNGVDALYPDRISSDIDQPTVVITDIKLLNESVVPHQQYNGVTVSDQIISRAQQIELSYKEKIISFEFSTFNFLDADLITYTYYLEGFDQQWNNIASKRHFASYTNLKPGIYTFKVKAAGPNGIFGDQATEMVIHILPPFWETIWFKLLVIVIFASAVFGYVRYRTYSLKHQKAVLEQQVIERTEEINRQKEALTFQSIQLQKTNESLEDKQKYIEGQNHELESKNLEIGERRDELLELNNKLKLVSQLRLSFFTNISHEFRTPLTLIIGPLERLMSSYNFGEEVKNNLEVINRNAKRLLHLINEIMDFRKIEQGKTELKVSKGNIVDFSKRIFEAFEPLSAIKNIAFSFDSLSEDEPVWFDAEKIENILYNLLSNAFKYTPNDGTIQMVISSLTIDDAKLDLGNEYGSQDQVVISIKIIDSGSGISEENLPLIFKRFYRIESENAFKIGGSGIGLAITEELIKVHHGEIFVSSHLGEGSVFEIQFPCLKDVYSDVVTRSEIDSTSIYSQVEVLKNELLVREEEVILPSEWVVDQTKSTVLVVEDNADLRKFISLRLGEKYNIVEASNGLIGLEFAEKYNPDLIVSDVMMPKMNGFELCASVKNNFSTSHIPVVLLTAKSSVENQIEGLQIGADDYLPKPFNFELLEARISNLIDSRRKLREQFSQQEDVPASTFTQNTKDQKFLEQAIATVNEHLADAEFGSKDLVTALGISRSLLHKKLTALTDQSASEFINHLRMKKSKQLLKNVDMNISEVAYSVGYNDPKYFSRLFSKHFGYSPKQFQEDNQSLT